MVTDGAAVLSIARDEGALAAMRPGTIWAQILASGPDATRHRVAPLFDALGQRTLWSAV